MKMTKENGPNFKKKRLEQLFDECQQQVISNIIGPFGLSTAMFEDKNGGNVTTLHNFKRNDDQYVATESDKILHAHSKSEYERSKYEINPKEWDRKRQEQIQAGVDGYTGKSIGGDGKTEFKGFQVGAELDHVKSLSEVHRDPINHLALGKVNSDGSVDVNRMTGMMNHDDNLVMTAKPGNASKSDHDLMKWGNEKRPDGKTNMEHYGFDDDRVKRAYEKSKQHAEKTANEALLMKQTKELLSTGAHQALQMGLRQSMGLLLAELVNSLFNEIKALIKYGIEVGKTLIQDVIARLKRAVIRVSNRFKDAMKAFFEGGISGFMSNLLTFLINQLVSTSKKIVRMIREGLIGLYKALKMLFFPPASMTKSEALQAGLKILSATVMVSAGILFEETLAAFLSTFPILAPISSMLTAVLVGIVTGILTALLAYQIDMFFHGLTEKNLDDLMINEQLRNQLAHTLSDSLLSIKEDHIKIKNNAKDIECLNASTKKNIDDFEKIMTQIKEKK